MIIDEEDVYWEATTGNQVFRITKSFRITDVPHKCDVGDRLSCNGQMMHSLEVSNGASMVDDVD